MIEDGSKPFRESSDYGVVTDSLKAERCFGQVAKSSHVATVWRRLFSSVAGGNQYETNAV